MSSVAKALAGAVVTAGGVFTGFVSDGTITGTEWAEVAVALVVGFATVWVVPNNPSE